MLLQRQQVTAVEALAASAAGLVVCDQRRGIPIRFAFDLLMRIERTGNILQIDSTTRFRDHHDTFDRH